MRRDECVLVIGEGVGLSDSADELTHLLDEFDTRRVVHTHIAESGCTGVGAAMVGLRPSSG